MISSPSFTASITPLVLNTAGIPRARDKMAEWEVYPPLAVTIPYMISPVMPTVIEGVKSSVTTTVPFGTLDRFTASIP